MGSSNKGLDAILAKLRKKGESLQQHQLEGQEVMYKWHNRDRGGIVADEMGLGKTCMTVVHLWRLYNEGSGPYAVLCPLSVMDHWVNEVKRFSTEVLNTVVFYGDSDKRALLVKKYSNEKASRNTVFLIPHHLFSTDQRNLSRLFKTSTPTHIVCDEAHVLKNHESRASSFLQKFDATFYLLTGTPIQNDISELYTLFSFIDPQRYPIEDIKEYLDSGKEEDKVEELRNSMTEYCIRRKKESVCNTLPSIQQVVFFHDLAPLQKQLYMNVLRRNRAALSGKNMASLVFLQMQLRKAVLHPYLFKGQEPEPFSEGEHLVEASSKLKVLDNILRYCKKKGHKCLIFSQFVMMLDVVQDYLNYREMKYARIDGSVRAEERFDAIKSFQKSKNDFDCFLLSTKAGGVGLTLTSADTVIFLDSDWNPHNDLQAMARCHRIGQNKPVRVIRLVCRFSVEQYLLTKARGKLRLTSAIAGEESEKQRALDVAKMITHSFAQLQKSEQKADFLLSDEQIEKIIGKTDRNSRWLPVEENDDEILEDVDEVEAKDIDKSDYFFFEGRTYRVDENDEKELRHWLGPVDDENNPPKRMTEEEEAEAEKRRAEKRRKRRESASVKRMKMWDENGYASLNVSLPSEGRESAGTVEEEEEDGEDIGEGGVEMQFVTGDVTRPCPEGPEGHAVVVVHVVDDSGEFGNGGLFSALDDISFTFREHYETAKEMDDVHLGDCHVIPFSNPSYSHYAVALIVAQKKKKRDELVLKALNEGLGRVCEYAKQHTATVHLARMSHGIKNVTWYAVEKTIKKQVALNGVRTYVYYRPRRGAQSVEEVDDEQTAQGTSHTEMKEEEEDDASTSYNLPAKRRRVIVSDSEGEEELSEQSTAFSGKTFYLSEKTRHLRSLVESAGGKVTVTVLDLYDVTDAVILKEENVSEALALSLLPEDTHIIYNEQYLKDAIQSCQ